MELDLILNELSLKNTTTHYPAINKTEAQKLMVVFLQTLREIKKHNVQINLRTQDDFYTTILAPNYPLRQWLNDKDVDRTQRLFIKTIVTKSPFSNALVNLEIKDIENDCGLVEFFYQDKKAFGLGIAYILNTIAVSLSTKAKWNFSYLQLQQKSFGQDEEIIHNVVEVIHASCNNHIKEHSKWIKDKIRSSVNDGKELWNRKQELFPNLEFCDSVKKQLENILSGQLELQPVVKTLLIFQDYCHTWKSGNFNIKSSVLEYSPESNETLNNSKYKRQREFICPDGKTQLFSLHAKLRVCNWRIYFYPEKPGKVVVGYIGLHLPTVKYK